jgi:hypothetical protein
MQINLQRPPFLFRYTKSIWAREALELGEFLLKPASSYKSLEGDEARGDDELNRIQRIDPSQIKITLQSTGMEIKPTSPVEYNFYSETDYLILCFSSKWDLTLFDDFQGTDACLAIRDVDAFAERFHAATETQIFGFHGVDAAVTYGDHSPLGVAFSKPLRFGPQLEYRFAMRPQAPRHDLKPMKIRMGSLTSIAELRFKP